MRCLLNRPGEESNLHDGADPPTNKEIFLTYFVLLEDKKQLVTRSIVRPAKDLLFPNQNQRPTPADGDTSVPVTKHVFTSIQDYYNSPVALPTFSPDELLGMTVLRQVDDNFVKAKVVRKIVDRDSENHQQIKFLLALGDGQLEEIITYNELSDLVEESKAVKESGRSDLATVQIHTESV